jgi:phenylalanyl-tRNA synthetase beta chain
MKISYNWLRQYHTLDSSPDKVAEMLTGCGLEVESIEPFQSVKGGLKGVVTGEVLTCIKHPNSDHLSITTVDIGAAEPLHIVCGAANVAQGQKVAVATIGTTLYMDDKEITLQRTKIRGEVSEGMICAEDELGLGTSHDGIMVLDASTPVGIAASEFFNIEEDIVFTIGLTPNRVDASSHAGVARDLAAVANNFGQSEPIVNGRTEFIIPDVSAFKIDNKSRHVSVTVEDAEACPRYSGLTVSGIKVAESPDWLKNRLLSIGLRPINNIVDITNYVLMEVGQPLHAFDSDRITGNKVVIKKYPKGTRFVTLDNIERELSENDLMISSATEPMCIAGVFGGAKSGVTAETTSIFLESAYFDPRHIRRSSKFHGLQTDASFRFERGANYDITVFALKRAAMLIREIAGGVISSEIVDVYPTRFEPRTVNLTYQNLDRLIGKRLHRSVVKSILSDLGIALISETEAGIRVEIPAFKVDVTREADVIEEILRVYGYNNIELHDEIKSSLSYTPVPDPEKVQNQVSDYLAASGFNEIMNNSLTRMTYYAGNPDFPAEECVKMLNPISRDLDVMRQTLLYGVLESVVYNQNRKTSDLKMFEFGRVYSTRSTKKDPLPGYHEEKHLAMIITGRLQPENWSAGENQSDFYALKGFMSGAITRIGIDMDSFRTEPFQSGLISEGLQFFHNDKPVGILGSVSREVMKAMDCKQPLFYADVNWDTLFSLVPAKNKPFKGIPRFPEVRRDLALVFDQATSFAQIETAAFQAEKKLLKKIGLFDVYEGDKIAAGKKSYALNFILQDEEKTLTDKEIEKSMGKILQAMVTNFNAQLR